MELLVNSSSRCEILYCMTVLVDARREIADEQNGVKKICDPIQKGMIKRGKHESVSFV